MKFDLIPPGSTIGILGGGQLGRMIALAAAPLGYRCCIYEPQADCPAAQVATAHITAAYDDEAALTAFAQSVDVVTLEFENVAVEALELLQQYVPVHPAPHILAIAQNRIAEKSFLNDCDAGTAPWGPVQEVGELPKALERVGMPAVIKTARLGYDGRGQAKVTSLEEVRSAWKRLGAVPCILEGFVPLEREISTIIARNARGEMAAYEPAENQHRNHILHKTLLPATLSPGLVLQARRIAEKLAESLGLIGLLAVEMFVTTDRRLLVNELAPRPHNSGHWTQDACATSQFEQLVRAICGLPLGSTQRLTDVEMTNLLGDDVEQWREILDEPNAHLHLYGKSNIRPGRKMGHVNRVV